MKFLLALLFICMATPLFAEEPLPIAPSRSDDRDQLPTTPFVSLTGVDPVVPDQYATQQASSAKPASPAKGAAAASKNTRKPASVSASKSIVVKRPSAAPSRKRVTKKPTTVSPSKKNPRVPANLPKKLPRKKESH